MIVADQPGHNRDLRHGAVEEVGDDRVPLFELRQHIGFVRRRYAKDVGSLHRPGRRMSFLLRAEAGRQDEACQRREQQSGEAFECVLHGKSLVNDFPMAVE